MTLFIVLVCATAQSAPGCHMCASAWNASRNGWIMIHATPARARTIRPAARCARRMRERERRHGPGERAGCTGALHALRLDRVEAGDRAARGLRIHSTHDQRLAQ